MTQLIKIQPSSIDVRLGRGLTPALIDQAGHKAKKRFWEFLTAEIRNPNTRKAYGRAILDFTDWCEIRSVALNQVEPMIVAAYIEEKSKALSAPTVKQHLAALRMLFDYLVLGQALVHNPAASVRGPKYVVKEGKTPVLSGPEARQLLESIDVSNVVGLRDRALIAMMIFSFARVSAAINMKVKDYYSQGKRSYFRLHEKGGKFHVVPAHHTAEACVDAYIGAAGIAGDRDRPLFRASDRSRAKRLGTASMTRQTAIQMIKRRARAAGLPREICCHSFRATGITAFLASGGTIEAAARIAGHESPRTTSLYDRRNRDINIDEIERIIL
jgi:site-specific recombinase XerD